MKWFLELFSRVSIFLYLRWLKSPMSSTDYYVCKNCQLQISYFLNSIRSHVNHFCFFFENMVLDSMILHLLVIACLVFGISLFLVVIFHIKILHVTCFFFLTVYLYRWFLFIYFFRFSYCFLLAPTNVSKSIILKLMVQYN